MKTQREKKDYRKKRQGQSNRANKSVGSPGWHAQMQMQGHSPPAKPRDIGNSS